MIPLVRGELYQEGGNPLWPDDLMVEVYDPFGHLVSREPVTRGGNFDLRNVEAGHYLVKITNLLGEMLHQDHVFIGDGHLSLRFPGWRAAQPASGTVSAQSILRGPRLKAAKEFDRSQKAFSSGHIQESLEHLQRAVEIAPDFVEAHNNLGARYMALEQYQKAAAEFQKAVELNPRFALAPSNLSAALLSLQRYPEAEAAARRAIETDPGSLKPRYLLGLALVKQGKYTAEALENLRKAAEEFPKAGLLAAQILAALRRRD